MGGWFLIENHQQHCTWYAQQSKKTNHRTHKTCTGINETKKTKLSRSLGPSPWPEVIFYLLFFWGLSRSCNIKKTPEISQCVGPQPWLDVQSFFYLCRLGGHFLFFCVFAGFVKIKFFFLRAGAAINHVGDNRTANVHRTPSNIYNQWGPILIAKLTFSRPLPIDYFAAQFALYDLVW